MSEIIKILINIINSNRIISYFNILPNHPANEFYLFNPSLFSFYSISSASSCRTASIGTLDHLINVWPSYLNMNEWMNMNLIMNNNK
jgi:hypothetical protein